MCVSAAINELNEEPKSEFPQVMKIIFLFSLRKVIGISLPKKIGFYTKVILNRCA